MAEFTFDALIDYGDDEPNGIFGKSDGTNDQTGPITSSTDSNDEFIVGEDLTGAGIGNDYFGYLVVNGVQLPVLYGSDGVNQDTQSALVGLHSGITRADLPDTFDTTSTDPFFAQTFVYCFAEGTLIRTDRGEVPVEDLTRDDRVLTLEGALVPVLWLGVQTIDSRFAPARALSLVKIAAGALGYGLPERDLTVTGDHGMIVDGMVVNAAALVNGSTITAVPRSEMADRVRVYHVETPGHEAIFANGALSETFIDMASRTAFDNCAEYLELYGAERIVPEMDMVRITSARLLPEDTRARLGIAHDLDLFADCA